MKVIHSQYKSIPIRIEMQYNFSTVWVNRRWHKTVANSKLKQMLLDIKGVIDGKAK